MLRRRKQPSNDDEGDLSERLLADDDASESHARHKSVIVYEPFSLEGFLRYVLLQCRFLVDCINRFLAYLRGSAPSAPPISPLQQQRVNDLQQKLVVQFDLDNEEHQQGLKDLWKHGFPGLPFEGFKCERWKEMGWQNQDPTTDIRGAGYFGVQNLLYMAAMHYRLFDKLMHTREGVRSEWEYPFAAAGLNITVQLAQLLELTKPGGLPKSAPGRAFLVLLEDDEQAFEELYCMTYALLDQQWLATGASYMQFNAVLKECNSVLAAALVQRPRNVEQLWDDLELEH